MATFKVLLGIFLIAAIVGDAAAKKQCSGAWMLFGDNCYIGSEDAEEPWDSAEAACRGAGGHLAVPRSQEEEEYLAGFAINQEAWFWLGCDDNAKEGEFVCQDGKPMPTDFVTFKGKEPDNGEENCKHDNEENCVAMTFNGHWADQACHKKRKFVCQKEAI